MYGDVGGGSISSPVLELNPEASISHLVGKAALRLSPQQGMQPDRERFNTPQGGMGWREGSRGLMLCACREGNEGLILRARQRGEHRVNAQCSGLLSVFFAKYYFLP